ncbi:MAG: DUF4836 family protein [Saprospiraceae bacterium]
MKFFRKTALLFLLVVAAMSVQAQNLKQYIPSDATFVVSMDLANLDNKISFDKLKEFDFYKEGMKEFDKEMSGEKKELAEALKNPAAYGIDVMSETYMFGNISKESSFFGFAFNISDSKKFSKFFKNNIVPEAKGAVMGMMGKFQTMTEDGATFAWNDKVGILVGGEPNAGTDKSVVDGYVKKVLNGNPKTSIMSDVRFNKATKGKKSDMRMWMDYSWVMDMQMGGSEMAGVPGMEAMMTTLKELYKDTDYLVEMNFNDGAVVMDSKMYSNKKTMDMFAKMTEGELNKNFYKYLPKNNLMGYFSLAMKTENFADGMFQMFDPMIKEMGMTREAMEGMALGAVNSMGLEMDAKGLYEIIRGDMVFAVTGMKEFTIKKTQYDDDFNKVEVEAQQMLPEVLAMMSYGREADLKKIVQMGVDAGALTKVGNAFKVAIPMDELPMDMFLSMKDGILFITNNSDLATGKLKDGYSKSDRMTKDQQKLMKESGGAFFWDIPSTLNAASAFAKEEGMNDKMAEKMLNVSKQSLESMVVKTDKKIKGSYNSEFKLNFVNKKMNSLEQLFNYFNEMYLTAMNSGGM